MKYENLRSELHRFRIAYNVQLSRDVEPISEKAVIEGLELLKFLDDSGKPDDRCPSCGTDGHCECY